MDDSKPSEAYEKSDASGVGKANVMFNHSFRAVLSRTLHIRFVDLISF